MSRKRKNNTGIPDFEIDALARVLLSAIQKYFETEEGKKNLKRGEQRKKTYNKLSPLCEILASEEFM
jgi:hypothetical protein